MNGLIINNFLKESSIVSISKVMIAAINFILIYIYTNNLTMENYGLLELLFSFAQIVIVFFTFGLPSAFTRYYLLYKNNISNIISTIYTIHFVCASILLFVSIIFSIFYDEKSISIFSSVTLVVLILGKQFLLSSSLLSQRYFLANKYFLKVGIINLIYYTFLLIVSYVSLVLYNNNLIMLLLAHSVVTFFYSFILFLLISKEQKISLYIDKTLYKEILLFSLPFVPSGIAYFVLTMSDRFFIKYFLTLEDLALYSLGYKIASVVVLVIITPINIVFTQYVYKLAKENKHHEIISLYDIIVKLYILAGVSLVIISPLVVELVAPVEYQESSLMVKYFIFSSIIYGLNYFYVSGINISGKTKYQMYAIFIGMILNIILNYFFINLFGLYGTLYSSILSFLIVIVITIYYSQKFYYLPFNFIKTSLYLISGFSIMVLIDNSFFYFEKYDNNIRIIVLMLILYKFYDLYRNYKKGSSCILN